MRGFLIAIGGTGLILALAYAMGAPPQLAGQMAGGYLVALLIWSFAQKKTPRR